MIYYIPFQVETYEAITAENIQEKATYKIAISDKTAHELVALIGTEGQSAELDKKRVRLLVKTSDQKELLVDTNGHALVNGTQFEITAKSFASLKSRLTELTAK
jgi:hypothetical protein